MTIRRGTRQTGWWLAVVLCCAGCAGGDTGQGQEPAADEAPRDWFVDRAVESGLDIVHFNGMSGEFYYPEIMGPGVALLDFDGDGDLDIYIVQGQMLGGRPLEAATLPAEGPLRDRLFRNDLTLHPDGTRTMRFVDVTEEAGIDLAIAISGMTFYPVIAAQTGGTTSSSAVCSTSDRQTDGALLYVEPH